ncbi:S8 family peptidase [Ruminococcus sp.]|uniref:S8 family peptidase n=1 Tax=Ruminococcus sp. TaxID=41978 RepID=UPI0025DFFFE2|nr:S8 family peptidase [Ruminococcus sp.]
MNDVLELKGKRFVQAAKAAGSGGVSMNGKIIVTSEHICNLIARLQVIRSFWLNENRPFSGILISVYYNKIVAKSNRVSGLLKGADSNHSIVGAKFNAEKTKHIITYYINFNDLDNTISLLNSCNHVLIDCLNKKIDQNAFKSDIIDRINFKKYGISKSCFKQVIADISYIDTFEIETMNSQIKQSIITLYDTGLDTKTLLKEFGIEVINSHILDNLTVFLDENQFKALVERAPYLIAMATEDLSALSPFDFNNIDNNGLMYIPEPGIEPTIGVIDTLFCEDVYFSKWVEYHDMTDDNIPKTTEDQRHGTAVSSIIVDGPTLNPWLDDGCGRFKVRHFGVAKKSGFSSFTIIKLIRQIVADNRDIKVWNISLGSDSEISDNFISAEAAVLDQIQYENDVIFVIAGTNKSSDIIQKIGSPADSINSMVVNSVTKSGVSTTYSRRGLALSFFAKPDVSYYGGSKEQYIHVCEPLGDANVSGTSFAAPWIARKLSYLIDVLGMNREVAKAMIIDAARGWNTQVTPEVISLYGHGIVPIRIEQIIQSQDDEIKFLVTDISEKWNTYNYHFPIPMKGDHYPYIAKATMCYFPICNRSQGVDYTNTELNLHFGRIGDDGRIKEINDDKQNLSTGAITSAGYILEGDARALFRKWDNVKYISEDPQKSKRTKPSYKNKNWGMEVKTNNRLDPKDGVGLRFGVVVTVKAIDGVNRIDEFIRNCHLNGWIVNVVEIQNRIDLHEKINEEIEFEQ